MIYNQYGRTGKTVSAVGFGGMRFDTSRSLQENAELLLHAAGNGINYFDTAPGYCSDQSEDIFGLALKQMTTPYFVSTKGQPVQFDTAQKARDAVHRSLERLGVSKIDFYHVWCLRKMEHYELAMQPGGQYEGLLQCQQEGLIDHIVMSSHQPGSEIRQMLSEGKVEGVLLGMHILNFPYRWDGVQAAHEMGYGVVAMNPLAGGLIPQNADKLAFLGKDGETPVEAALRFIISCPQITVALNGFTTHEQIDMACRIADASQPFTDEDIARVQQHLTSNMNAICTSCGYCDHCPQDIPIPSYMQAYNSRQMFDATDEAMMNQLRFDQNWGLLVGRKADASACVNCGRCEEACTQHLNIVERLQQLAEWEAKIAQG